ncbi:unnamed protein product [Knipowitschia caucasica]|uniref:Secreted protein n=1 Tax=Knipowitschia caucasica TaxID=637954 RepID=A0AAV2IZ60_KNICA
MKMMMMMMMMRMRMRMRMRIVVTAAAAAPVGEPRRRLPACITAPVSSTSALDFLVRNHGHVQLPCGQGKTRGSVSAESREQRRS